MNIDSKTSPRHWRIEDILLYLNNNVKKTTAGKILHSILISSDILTWNPQGEIVYHGRDIPVTNIENLLQYALLPNNSHIPEPRGLDLFTKGLVESGINKDLIKNESIYCQKWQRRNMECRNLRVMLKANQFPNLIRVIMKANMMMMMVTIMRRMMMMMITRMSPRN